MRRPQSRSSLRLLRLCSVQANDTCILTLVSGVTYFERDTGLGMVWGGWGGFFWRSHTSNNVCELLGAA